MEIYNGPVAAGNFTRTLELKSLAAGTYYIKIASGEDVLIEKMIVK